MFKNKWIDEYFELLGYVHFCTMVILGIATVIEKLREKRKMKKAVEYINKPEIRRSINKESIRIVKKVKMERA